MKHLTQTAAPYVALFSFILLVASIYKRNDFTDNFDALTELNQEPIQTAVKRAPFTAEYNNEFYEIKPKFDYNIYGLVVSYRLHDAEGNTMLHDLTKDHLNVADFCVVWGQSANSTLLKDMDFNNGQFTCNYSSKSRTVWDAFNHDQLSNNHLLALDDDIRDQIDDIKIGDQIHIKGWLSHYVNPLGYERGTSITRTDTGNGACETIFVNEINIIKSMSSQWRYLIWLSLLSLCFALWTIYHTPVDAKQFGKSRRG